MRRERGLRPVLNDASCRDGNQLLRAIVNQTNHLRACGVVESPRGKQLRDLLAELCVAFESGFDVGANRSAEAFL